jgi:hypothetical protein
MTCLPSLAVVCIGDSESVNQLSASQPSATVVASVYVMKKKDGALKTDDQTVLVMKLWDGMNSKKFDAQMLQISAHRFGRHYLRLMLISPEHSFRLDGAPSQSQDF